MNRKFKYLPPDVKQKVLDAHRDWDMDSDWWDHTYEDAIEAAKCMGLEIDKDKLYFNLSYSQGDGVTIGSATWHCKPDAVEAMKEYAPRDDRLISIAEKWIVLQTTFKLETGHEFSADYTGHERRRNELEIVVDADIEEIEEGLDRQIHDLVNNFADWLYWRLREECDYLSSDKYLIEVFKNNDHLHFDELGSIV